MTSNNDEPPIRRVLNSVRRAGAYGIRTGDAARAASTCRIAALRTLKDLESLGFVRYRAGVWIASPPSENGVRMTRQEMILDLLTKAPDVSVVAVAAIVEAGLCLWEDERRDELVRAVVAQTPHDGIGAVLGVLRGEQ
jgi:hypothetical protein